jgi:hypothetical protein
MIGARWVVVGALLAGCVFTPRPMIPLEGDDADSANRATDAAAADVAVRADAPSADLGPTPEDVVPPTFDAGVSADVPAVMTPDASAGFDAGGFADAGAFDVGVGCDVLDGACDDAATDADAAAEPDAAEPDATEPDASDAAAVMGDAAGADDATDDAAR